MKDTNIQWHPGFVGAMNLELRKNRGDLLFEKEYNLNTKPLEIDLLVIRKDTDIQIDNEIGKIFLGHNILEYKSPKEELNIDTLYKATAYASLYKSYGETVNAISAEDITVSLVRKARPDGLFRYFKKHGYLVSNPYHGVYYVKGKVLFPTQIIVTKELDPKEHVWLGSLSDQLEKQNLQDLLEEIHKLHGKADIEYADSVLEVSIHANLQTVEELRGDDQMCQALLEIMEPEINKIKESVTESVTKSVTESVTKSVTESVTKSVTESVTRSVTESVTESVTKSVTEANILCAIDSFRSLGVSDVKIKELLITKFHLPSSKAETYF